ncbi:MAG TPA: glycoside hydrolase family 57 protein [Phycisphaerales bacterium]|nr:glycoside hydrolase family 57 protein [Phycisphaerales bacterium]
MASVVFYFEVHQPHRLRRYSVFDSDPYYFDDAKNGEVCRKVADKCYRPTTRLILDMVKRHKGNFRVSYAITGTVLEQWQQFCPDVIGIFQELAKTGCCEFVGETYYHSLSALYSKFPYGDEFDNQVQMHTEKIQELFGQTPQVFRNTELIYNNDLAWHVSKMKGKDGKPRWKGMICEGVDRLLGSRSPNYVYTPPGRPMGKDGKPFATLCKNYRLSDDIAFRFSNRGWSEWPLSAEKFAQWVNNINGDGYLCNLFMDYETFGEHQWADTGIFDFLSVLPEKVFEVAKKRDGTTENHFITPSMAIDQFQPVGEYDAHEFISWADTERDLSAWRENAMQFNALSECYALEKPIKERYARAMDALAKTPADNEERHAAATILTDWRKLTTSDHFYYMCTKYFADGDVHKYFSPYDSPYDAYINYMNVLDNLRQRLASGKGAVKAKETAAV